MYWCLILFIKPYWIELAYFNQSIKGRFSKDNVTWKADATARGIIWTQLPVLTSTFFGQGRVAFTTAFMLFSRREDNAKDLEIFASEKGNVISLNDWNILFNAFSMTFFGSCQKAAQKKRRKKAAQKAATFQRCFDWMGFLPPGCFSTSAKHKQYYASLSAKNYEKTFFLV